MASTKPDILPQMVTTPVKGALRAIVLWLDCPTAIGPQPDTAALPEAIASGGNLAVLTATVMGPGLDTMISEALAALDRARQQARESGARLYLMAASVGAVVLLETLRRSPAGVSGAALINPILDTGPFGFRNAAITDGSGPSVSPMSAWQNEEPASRSFKLLIVQGRADQVAPANAARRFAEGWGTGKIRLVEVANEGHLSLMSPGNAGRVAALVRDLALRAWRPKTTYLPKGTSLLYGIGAQKAGTSWLFDYLKDHPDCHVPELKELHYFDVLYGDKEEAHRDRQLDLIRETVARLSPPFDAQDGRELEKVATWARHLRIYADGPRVFRRYVQYLSHGRQDEKLLTDITPSYMTLDAETFRTMDRVGPAKFLFILRDPVDRLWSQIRMDVANEGDGLSPDAFEAACAARATQMCGTGQVSRIPRADYDRTLRELEWAIPADRIKYVFHEPTFSQSTLDEICDFAEIARKSVPPTRSDLRGRDATLPSEIESLLHEALAPQYRAMAARFGALPESWRREPTPRLSRQINSAPLPRRAKGANGPTIAFLHIPKTAGMSVISEIRRIVGEKASSPITLHTQANRGRQMPEGYRFYAGHLDWEEVDSLPNDRFVFTVLRDPKERIASFYFYSLREAQKCSAEELQSPERTNMRLISTLSADEYFFGGTPEWQRFIRDQYDNFYCTYLATRKMRASARMEGLSTDERLRLALRNVDKIDRIYMVDDLGPLEADLGAVLGSPVRLRKNFKNAGPKAGQTSRWAELAARFEKDDSLRRLEQFAVHDDALVRALGFGGKDG
ncbi:hypothetical protein EU803_11055 [Loktanella sp. IMCC34160]|uniref:sulfotransferase n=1 Tax=Loktanella sp. IMCC34160 TaxID=2510646 RepID=UPI00101C7867|nr:sulfotransferase [Loktanella sp. IMCC34160]RYG90541.1 hypothetical protein EU803_11055 [Loktanella sp. IMCC34160]